MVKSTSKRKDIKELTSKYRLILARLKLIPSFDQIQLDLAINPNSSQVNVASRNADQRFRLTLDLLTIAKELLIAKGERSFHGVPIEEWYAGEIKKIGDFVETITRNTTRIRRQSKDRAFKLKEIDKRTKPL